MASQAAATMAVAGEPGAGEGRAYAGANLGATGSAFRPRDPPAGGIGNDRFSASRWRIHCFARFATIFRNRSQGTYPDFRGTKGDLPYRPPADAAKMGLSPLHTAEKTARAADP